jgi:deoxyribodipyrimidine photo-lyase
MFNLFWFRRDLRLEDNAGLYHALREGYPVRCLFIFDTDILDKLEDKNDPRISFIYQAIVSLHQQLTALGSSLEVAHGRPLEVLRQLASTHLLRAVFANHDYEPYAIGRDGEVASMLSEKSIAFHTVKDQVIFEKDEVLSGSHSPYTVFTPYSKKWKSKLNSFYLKAYPTEKYLENLHKIPAQVLPPLEAFGFKESSLAFPKKEWAESQIRDYGSKRDYPAVEGTSRLGIHLRFGTISIRRLVASIQSLSETYLNELIWREFYMMILYHFPHVVDSAFRRGYNDIPWRNNEGEFQAWCEGKTGYPLVDAGMRQLKQTGYMHNRVRMVTASFLIKHLLIDWRWGEAYFAKKLLDYELASNNGGWQWAAGSGTDAAPYFRVFNPQTQLEKFDPQGHYIRTWIQDLGTPSYPAPIVAHAFARERVLKAYGQVLKKTTPDQRSLA